MAEAGPLRDLRLGEGGLLHRIELRARLTGLRQQLVAAVALTWVPLLALGLVSELVLGRRDPLLRDVSVHVRLLVAAPVFVVIDRSCPAAGRNTLVRLVREGFVRPSDEPRLANIARSARQLTDSTIPEVFLGLAAFGVGVAGVFGVVSLGGLARNGRLSASQIWYGLAAWPFFQFLLWRSLWRWVVWGRILFAVSRIDLVLVPSHPDKRGGVTFLSQPSISYCALFLFAVSSVLSAEWAEKISIPNVERLDPLLVAYVVAAALIAFGPLLPFAPMLERARNAGLEQCGELATSFARHLQAEQAATDTPISVNPERLAYMTIIFNESVDRVRVVLFDRRDVIVLLVATLLPVVPVALAQIPREDWTVLLKLVTGARLH